MKGVFPDMTDEEVAELVTAICGEISERESRVPENTSAEMLKLIGALDPQERESFKGLIDEALDKLATEEKKITNKIRLEAKLEAMNSKPSADPEKLQAEKEVVIKESKDEKKRSGATVRVATHERTRAPPELLKYLPQLPQLYLHWEVRHNKVWVEFKQLKGYQRTKSQSFDKAKSFRSKVAALGVCFEYLHQAYHLNFKAAPNYQADWKPSLCLSF